MKKRKGEKIRNGRERERDGRGGGREGGWTDGRTECRTNGKLKPQRQQPRPQWMAGGRRHDEWIGQG